MSTTKKLWLGLAALLIASFSVMLWLGADLHQTAPPIPNRVVTDTGKVIYTRADIDRGRQVWQSAGGQQLGSIWGHGALIAPDWSADWLHREIEAMAELDARAETAEPYSMLDDADKARIVIIRDGMRREIEFSKDQPSILDAASAAGLEVPFSCTSGVCGTCRAKLVEGEVRMERNFALDKAEVAGGFVLTCQAHPLTERVVLSFDER